MEDKKSDKNQQEGASWETVTEMEGGLPHQKTDQERDCKQNSLLSSNQSPLEGQWQGPSLTWAE